MSTAKYISKYKVRLELHNSEIRIFDQDKNTYLVLGQLTDNGIERNRNVTKEESDVIRLLYRTAERYFTPKKKGFNKITARFVLDGFWLELHDDEIRIYLPVGEKYLVLGKLTQEDCIILDENFLTHCLVDNLFIFYKIAMDHFSVTRKEEKKQRREQKIKARRELIQKGLKKNLA